MFGYFSPNTYVVWEDRLSPHQASGYQDPWFDGSEGVEDNIILPARLTTTAEAVQIIDSKGMECTTNTVIYINVEDFPNRATHEEYSDRMLPQMIGLEDKFRIMEYKGDSEDIHPDGDVIVSIKKIEQKRDLGGNISIMKFYVI